MSPVRRRSAAKRLGSPIGPAALVAVALATAGGCTPREPAPDAEFLFVTGDSTFWVTAISETIKTRGAPMLVARVDGRFTEIYVVDDDRSYFDAVFVGHRLFARDLERGDSVELHHDTTVTRLAMDYARRHPDESQLGPEDPENDNPAIRATADIEILGVHGPYLSYEHHTDVETRDEASRDHRHRYRRGVIDVRSGKEVRLSDLFARRESDSTIAAARAEWIGARDTILARLDAGAARVRRTVADFEFSATSFGIGSDGQAPTVRFAVPGSGTNPDIEPVELGARTMSAPAWWTAVAPELPAESGSIAAWSHGDDTVVVNNAAAARSWTVSLARGGIAARPVAQVSSAVERVLWLDSLMPVKARNALRRAFAEAGDYEGERQIAAAGAAVHLASHERFGPPRPSSTRVAVRVVRADDAAGRECAWARIRRRAPRDAGQDGRGVRDATCAETLRHRLD